MYDLFKIFYFMQIFIVGFGAIFAFLRSIKKKQSYGIVPMLFFAWCLIPILGFILTVAFIINCVRDERNKIPDISDV